LQRRQQVILGDGLNGQPDPFGEVPREEGDTMQTWEYTTVVQKHSSETGEVSTEAAPINFNQLGDQGWELVAVVPITLYQQMWMPRTLPLKYFLMEYVFKRPKAS
jgi:hypothetical protein